MPNTKSLDDLIQQSYQLILCGQEGAANASLAKVYDGLLQISPPLSADKMQLLSQLLPIMLDAQQRRDMIYLADILHFEVRKILP